MIDLETLSAELGAPRAPGPDDLIQLRPGARLSCLAEGWTLFLEDVSLGDERLVEVFDACRTLAGVVPMTTRSGHLALRYLAQPQSDDTARALILLRAVMERPFAQSA